MRGIHVFVFVSALAFLILGLCWNRGADIQVRTTLNGVPVTNARVYFDGVQMCFTPCAFNISPGVHDVSIIPPDESGPISREWKQHIRTFINTEMIDADLTAPR